jgi:hypothetical protein
MKKFATMSLLSLCLIIFTSNLFGQTCTPAGITHAGPVTDAFNFISNPGPTTDTCWAHDERATFVTGVTSCSSFGNTVTNNAFAFSYAGSIYQDIVIPASDTRTYFSLSYYLDFDDPNNDPTWNRFSALVYDATTGVYLYQSGNYTGSMPDLLCTRRESPAMYFPNTLAGHTIRIYFRGSSAYTDTHIRVYGMGFWGWN